MLETDKVLPIINKIRDVISDRGYFTTMAVKRRWPNLFNETRMKTLPRRLLNKHGYVAEVVWMKKPRNRKRATTK